MSFKQAEIAIAMDELQVRCMVCSLVSACDIRVDLHVHVCACVCAYVCACVCMCVHVCICVHV